MRSSASKQLLSSLGAVSSEPQIDPPDDVVDGRQRPTRRIGDRLDEEVHALDVHHGRDFPTPPFVDLRRARFGDRSPRSAALLKTARGIEVGHVFKLGTKYSSAMDACFLAPDGKRQPIIMGCYGIGVTRTMAACVEMSSDENGIVWPLAIAPYAANATR